MSAIGKKQCNVNIVGFDKRAHLAQVVAIDQQVYEQPWNKKDFIRHDSLNYRGIVAKLGKEIVGYLFYRLGKSKFHIVNIVVRPGYRRCQIASQMIQRLIAKLSNRCRTWHHVRIGITLEVHETSLVAQVFFRNFFQSQKQGLLLPTKVLWGYYKDGGILEDAYCMEYRIPTLVVDALGRPINRIGHLL